MYQQIAPREELTNFVHSFWMHRNTSDQPEYMTIVPDSYTKVIFIVQDNRIIQYFMTGLWIREREFIMPANSTSYGVRLKILAPEYLLGHELASLLQDIKSLHLDFWELGNLELSSFADITGQWETTLINQVKAADIPGNKLRLSQLLDTTSGDISAKEVAKQIYWTNRQINRYLNRYWGVSLKRYLNIQKVYQSYIQIREGRFYPEKGYFDRAHFVKEVKKHTGASPKTIHENQNDRFIQIKNIKPE